MPKKSKAKKKEVLVKEPVKQISFAKKKVNLRTTLRTKKNILSQGAMVAEGLSNPFTFDEYIEGGGNCTRSEIMAHFTNWEEFMKAVIEKAAPSVKHKLLMALQKPKTELQLCKIADCSPGEFAKCIAQLKEEGASVIADGEKFYISKTAIVMPRDKVYKDFVSDDFVRIGMISDTHLGSKCQQLTYLHDFYEVADSLGVTNIYNAGDITDGDGTVYRGHRQEIFLNGHDEYIDYVAKHYPYKPNISTHFILGNHDYSFFKTAGINIGPPIEHRRPDMKYCGELGAYIQLQTDCKFYMHHPTGGRAYSLSYNPQKFAQNFQPHLKPNIYLVGHYHGKGWFGAGRNIEVFLGMCFQSQTTLFKAKGWVPDIGGMIVDLQFENGQLQGFRTICIPYKVMMDKDY